MYTDRLYIIYDMYVEIFVVCIYIYVFDWSTYVYIHDIGYKGTNIHISHQYWYVSSCVVHKMRQEKR